MQAPPSEFLYHFHSSDRLLFLFTFDAWNAIIISVLIRNVLIGKDRNLTQSSLNQKQKSNTIMRGEGNFQKRRNVGVAHKSNCGTQYRNDKTLRN